MNRELLDALEVCIKLINAGHKPEECIAHFPKFTKELYELLSTTDALTNLNEECVPADVMELSRMKLQIAASSIRASQKYKRTSINNVIFTKLKYFSRHLQVFNPIAGKLLLAIGIAGIFILVSGGLLITSAKSLPGDSLYPVKRAVEDIRVHITSDFEKRHAYEDIYTELRVEEIKTLLEMKRIQHVSLRGEVLSIGGTQWNVGGIPVVVQADTMIIGGIGGTKVINPGDTVEVEGLTSPDGWVIADEIHLQEYQFVGFVNKISPRYWVVSGLKLIITSVTQVDDGIKVGDDVLVSVHSEDSGLYAEFIQRADSLLTPSIIKAPLSGSSNLDYYLTETPDVSLLNGSLNEIKVNYWIVNGEILYIIDSTKIDEGIKIGDWVNVNYIVEYNGSFTALEIVKSDDEQTPSGVVPQQGQESEDNSADIMEPEDKEEHKESTPDPESGETPEPPEHDLDPN